MRTINTVLELEVLNAIDRECAGCVGFAGAMECHLKPIRCIFYCQTTEGVCSHTSR